MRRLLLTCLLPALLALPGWAHAAPPATGTSSAAAPLRIDLNDAFLRAEPNNLYVESRALDRPLLAEWWFWAAVAAGAAALVTAGVILSDGGTFAPDGELGQTSTADWMRF